LFNTLVWEWDEQTKLGQRLREAAERCERPCWLKLLRRPPAGASLLRTLTGHDAPVASVAFAPDGQALLSGSQDGTVRVWSAVTGALLRTLTHGAAVASVAFAPDGRTVCSGGGDGALRLWDVQTGALLRTLLGHDAGVLTVAFSPDGTTLASGDADGLVGFWAVATGKVRRVVS